MLPRRLSLALALWVCTASLVAAADPARVPARVVRVIDGDTVEVAVRDAAGAEHTETIRLIGVDTPETVHPRVGVQPWGLEASEFTKRLLPPGEPVFLELDVEERDRYGRLLAYLYLPNGEMLNSLLLSEGLAQLLTIPPNVKHVDWFVSLQREARAARRGMWGVPAFPPGTPVGLAVDVERERVAITNRTEAPLDLSGWRLISEVGGQEFRFPPGTVVPPGGVITVVSGRNARSGEGLLLWTRAYVWNNDGDPAALYDASDALVARTDDASS